MKIKKICAAMLCIICICVSFAAFASETMMLEGRANSTMQVGHARGVHQFGQFMSDEEAQACLAALDDTEVIEHIHKGMLRRDEEIYLDEFDEPMYPDQLTVYFTAIMNTYPDVYFISMMYQYYIYDDGSLASLVPIYTMSEDEIAQAQATIDEEVERVCAVVTDGMNDFDKITAVHDYFADHYSYDYKNLRDNSYMRKYNISGLFIDKTAVCQGYGLGFQYVMQKLGIECRTVQSQAMSHLWNLVQLENGNWYHVDITWDDPSQDWYGSTTPAMTDEEYALAIGDVRTYFMLSDNKIQSLDNPHHSYTPDGWALDDTYDDVSMFDIDSAITYCNGLWYYVDKSGYMHSYDSSDNVDKVLFKTDLGWPYVSSFTDVYTSGGKIYYNTANDIMVYDPSTGETGVYLDNPQGVGGSAYIYAMSISGSTLTYVTATDYLGANLEEHTAVLKTSTSATSDPNMSNSYVKISNAMHTASGGTSVTVIGGNEGVVVVADYEDGRLVSVKTCGLAGSVTFEDILADEIFIWKSASSMEPLCESYVIK